MMCDLHRVPFDAHCHSQLSSRSALTASSSSVSSSASSEFSCVHTIGALGLLLESAEQQLDTKNETEERAASDHVSAGSARISGAAAIASDSNVEPKSSIGDDDQGSDGDDEAQARIDLTTATEADVLAIVRRRRARCSSAVLRAISCELDEELVRAA
jgi:hypothetical protein